MATAAATTSTKFLLFSVLVNTTMANPEYSLQASRTIFVLSIFFPVTQRITPPALPSLFANGSHRELMDKHGVLSILALATRTGR